MLFWALIGLAALISTSGLIGLAVAAVLGRIGRQISELLELEESASTPLRRDADAAEHAGPGSPAEAADE